MGNNAVDISAIQAYAEQHQKELLTLATVGSPELRNLNIIPGIVDKYIMTTLEFGHIIKPYARSWNPNTDAADLTPRTLSTDLGQVELEEEPLSYRQTAMGLYLTGQADPQKHPFEAIFLQEIMKAVNHDIVTLSTFYGDKSDAGADAAGRVKKITDGFFEIIDDEITADNISSVIGNLIATGDITSANAVTKLKAFYRTAMENAPGYRGMPLKLYVSHTVMDAYNDHYQSLVGAAVYNKEFEKTYLEGTGKMCELVPMTGMGTSKRIILGPQKNFCMGVGLESDKEKVNIFSPGNPKVMGFFVAFNIGYQIASLKAVWTNENTIDDESSSSASASASSSSAL
jgi:hypothetical protein